jgi:hypothetical protein
MALLCRHKVQDYPSRWLAEWNQADFDAWCERPLGRAGIAGRRTATARAVMVSGVRRGMLPICTVRPLPSGRDGVTIDQSWQQQLCQGCSARLIRAGAVGNSIRTGSLVPSVCASSLGSRGAYIACWVDDSGRDLERALPLGAICGLRLRVRALGTFFRHNEVRGL